MLRKYTVGIIGAGNMGEAIIRGMLKSGQTINSRIIASNRNSSKSRHLKASYNIRTTNFNPTVVEIADIVIIAVKPQDIENVCNEVKPHLKKEKVIISIAAGISIKKLRKLLGKKPSLIRVMPNTPALIDHGVSVIYAAPSVKERDYQLAEEIFGAVGLTYRINKEEKMDSITALSGTGPAYIYEVIDTLAKTGNSLGLNKNLATELIVHTIIGAAKMVRITGEDPKKLWQQVASKGGTTVAAFEVLNKNKFSTILSKAVKEAAKRSKELGKL